jgi:hypothetical protein
MSPLHLDLLRTVLAVNGSLRRAKYRRALDRCGPFWSASRDEGKGGEWKSSVGTEPVAPWCPPIAPELAPFLRARDSDQRRHRENISQRPVSEIVIEL